MPESASEEQWNSYKKNEMEKIGSILPELGLELEEKQVHIKGERHHMSARKFVLEGKRLQDGKKVIIKISGDKNGKAEIRHDHEARLALGKITFSYRDFLFPREILFSEYRNYLVSVTEFIEEERPFLGHSLEKQFFLSLRALEAQSGAHLTIAAHSKIIKKTFGMLSSQNYAGNLKKYCAEIKKHPQTGKSGMILDNAFKFFTDNLETLHFYCDFLTHSDFVIHNLRIVGSDIFLLDHTSIHFGSKHESWARFMNYLILYNKKLEEALSDYLKNNFAESEFLNLKLMRIYKLAYLIYYYCGLLKFSKSNLYTLTEKRIKFWLQVLESMLNDKAINNDIIFEYKKERDVLRSKSEIERQRELKQL